MNTRNLSIGIITVVVIVGGYALYSSTMKTRSAANAAAAANATASTTPSADQVQAQDTVVGQEQKQPRAVLSAFSHTGKLPDGTVFDSSAMHDNVPFRFLLGTQDMIPGFQIGVNGMKVGGKRVMAIPPSLAYGNQPVTDPTTGKVVIPANTTVVFEVELVKVEAASSTPTTPTSTQSTTTTTR